MIGQRPPDRLTPFAARLTGGELRRRGSARGVALFQILEDQLELRDLSVEPFRRASKLHAPQLGKLGLVLLDPQPGSGQFGPCYRQFCFPLGQLRAQRGDLLDGVGNLRHQPRVYTRLH